MFLNCLGSLHFFLNPHRKGYEFLENLGGIEHIFFKAKHLLPYGNLRFRREEENFEKLMPITLNENSIYLLIESDTFPLFDSLIERT